MDLIDRLISIIEPTIDAMGYELVRVQIQGNRRQTLQIMADRKDGAGMTVDDCSDISHAVSAVLDVEDPIPGAYNLEVSSPGIDRPLTRAKDFVAWAGFECKLEAKGLVAGRKRFSGQLLGMDGSDVLLKVEGEDHRIPLEAISKAKLVLTDALIEAVTQDADQDSVASDNDNDIQDES
jgi:ribosome maturation factor RimP